jgi:hypothetical protein
MMDKVQKHNLFKEAILEASREVGQEVNTEET